MYDRDLLVSMAQESEDLREPAKTDDQAFHQRNGLLLELQGLGLRPADLLTQPEVAIAPHGCGGGVPFAA